ncbi:MAG TPA: penicillin-binding protein activator [Steroidobacteraceae bacterium]|nr:penicillin-binding protein activator [Steroidobacteraceae bacterium]
MQVIRHVTFRMLAAGALLALLASCQTTPGGPGPASATRAERLLRQGNHVEAARMYEQLASNNPAPARDEFALIATRAWLDANRADDAQRALELTGPQLPTTQHFERELLRAEVGTARGQYQAAWQQLSRLPVPALAADANRLFHLRQQVALRAGETAAAVQAGIARERIAPDESGRNRARRDLLSDLRSAIDRGLRVDPATSTDPIERGWIEVAQIASQAGRSPLSANAMIDRWRQRFPGHSASTIVVSEILDPAARPDAAGGRLAPVTGPVALLLPLSDRGLAATAGLIRDGFQWHATRQTAAGLADLRVYDTSTLTVAAAMQRAVADGASFIVGPLTREDVQAAAERRPAHVPMLLLNTLPAGGGAGAWQYALAPEDEARQIARQIAGAGGRSAVVVTPADGWGQRVAAAFTEEFTAAGGSVLAEGQYALARNDIEATLVAVLGIDASRRRHERVQGLVGTRVEPDPRPAPGIDAIFAAGHQALAMRQIRPYLRQHNAIDIPTYMTSEGVDGDRSANRDLEGMRLVEMPWTLDTVGAAYDVRSASEGAWSARGSARDSRYFAFGYDAARLAAALRSGIVAWPLDGVTGRLNLTPDGRIERQLNWARMRDGMLQPANPADP